MICGLAHLSRESGCAKGEAREEANRKERVRSVRAMKQGRRDLKEVMVAGSAEK